MTQPSQGLRDLFYRHSEQQPGGGGGGGGSGGGSSRQPLCVLPQDAAQDRHPLGLARQCRDASQAATRPAAASWPSAASRRQPRAEQRQRERPVGPSSLVAPPLGQHGSQPLSQRPLQQQHPNAVQQTQPPAAPPWYQQHPQPAAGVFCQHPPPPQQQQKQQRYQQQHNAEPRKLQHPGPPAFHQPVPPQPVEQVVAGVVAAAAAGAAASGAGGPWQQHAAQQQQQQHEQQHAPGQLPTPTGRQLKQQLLEPPRSSQQQPDWLRAHQPQQPPAQAMDWEPQQLPPGPAPSHHQLPAHQPNQAQQNGPPLFSHHHPPAAGPAVPPAVGQAWARPKQPLRLKLEEWALPPGVVQAFEARGVRSMYPWQAAALECGEAYNNLVYCAPTSGGKSLVAEVLMVRRLLASVRHIPQPRRSKPKYGRALVVLPYVSIVCEKSEHLQAVLRPMHAAVKGFYGGEEGQALGPRGETVAVCTIEKANVAINKLAQEGRLGELCCVVVDELHMVSDGDRGVGLEMSLSKLLFSPHSRHVQIIGMSATMGGLESLRAWLRAELFLTNFRPVPLTEHAVFRGKVYQKVAPQELEALEEGHPPLQELREVAPSDSRRDADRLVPLVAEATAEGHSVLVFCSSRRQCESAAALIADLLPQVAPPPAERQAELGEQRAGIVADIKIAMGGAMGAELEKCMLRGIAWHHAGLTSEERAGVERAYRCSAVSVITATSTLAAGVNLPARRVILRSLHQGIGPVSRSQYLQMVGRAGRAGHSAVGESFLIGKGAANSQEWHQVCALLTAPVPSLQSRVLSAEAASTITSKGAAALGDKDTQHLQQLLLEGIANGTVRDGGDVGRLVCSTFAACQQGLAVMRPASKVALRALLDGKRLVQFIPGQEGQHLELTHKGRAVYDSALPLDDAMQLYESCTAADNGFMLDRPLVLVYHCLLGHPFQIISWAEWGRLLQGLDKHEQQIAESVGVLPMHAHAAQSGRAPSAEVHARHARMAAALALSELTQEKDIHAVVLKWGREGFVSRGLSRGQIQKLQQDAGKWMGMAALLCESAGWWPLATLYSNLSQMAAAGVRQDLLPLMRIPDMDAAKARALFKAGLRDAQMLATADEQAVARALAPAIAQQMRSRSSGGKQQQQQRGSGAAALAATAGYAAAGMAARAAGTVVQCARDHLRQQMQDLAALAADIQEDEVAAAAAGTSAMQQSGQQHLELPALHAAAAAAGQTGPQQQARQPAAIAAGQDELSPDELAHIRRQVAQVAGPGGALPGSPDERQAAEVSIAPAAKRVWTQGVVRVTELRPRSPAAQLADFFASWAAQPHCSLALHTLTDEELAAAAAAAAAGGAGGKQRPESAGAGAGRLQGLAVCWDTQHTFYLELTAVHCARELRLEEGGGGGGGGGGAAATVLDAVRDVLARRSCRLVCYGALEALPELLRQGVALGGRLEDLRVAAALLWPDAAAGEPEKLDLRRLQAVAAPGFKARVPNLCRGGVTRTCRAAVLALVCMDGLRQLLAARRMLETFLNLECPAVQVLLHINASQAAPRLAAPALHAALEAARGSAEGAQEQLRRVYSMPRLDLGSNDTMMQLLGSLKMALPERKRGVCPVVTLDHLQDLLRRCRPHQQRQRQALAAMVQHKALAQHLLEPLQALLELAAGVAPRAAPGAGQRPGSAGARAAAIAAAAQPWQGQGQAVRLRLETCSATGRLSYGPHLDSRLAALLAADWCPFLACGCNLSVQAELEGGSLTEEAVAAACRSSGGALPVALCVPRCQLSARSSSSSAAAAAAAAAASDPFGDVPPEEVEEQQQVWVAGLLTAVVGKRLCTALDFGAQQEQPHGADGSSSSQRARLARVRVPMLPAEDSRLDSAAAGGSWPAAPSTVELQWSCDQLWRLAGPSAAVLVGGSGTGGIVSGTGGSGGSGGGHQQRRQQSGAAAACEAAAAPPLPGPQVSWGLHGYCSGAAVFAASRHGVAEAGHAAESGRRHKAPSLQQQQVLQEPAAAVAGFAPHSGGSQGGLLVRVELQHLELAVLAHLSGQPELQAACRSGAGAYQHTSNCWAAAAGQVEVPGAGNGGDAGGALGPPPLLITAGVATAVARCLAHSWSSKKLGWLLRCPRHAAAAAVESFLAAFPRLKAYLAEAAAAAEAACCAATLAGRQQQFGALKRQEDAMGRGKLHKAILVHVLGGSLADVMKAAVVSTHAALAGLGPSCGPRGDSPGAQQPQGPQVALVLGHSIVLHLPSAFLAAHGGSPGAASAAVGAAVLPGLRSLYVGRATLSVPLGARLMAGPSLHLFDQQPTPPAAPR